jgi:ABC-type multidrug transport system permease subunit
MAVVMFFCYYYPVGLYANAGPNPSEIYERGALFFLFMWQFLIFTSTFAHMMIAGVDTAENGGNIANLMFSLTLIFCGVLAPAPSLPGFWIFMYRVSPFTYFIGGFLATGIANTATNCADNEFVSFRPPQGQTCGAYVDPYIATVGGYLQDPNATEMCQYCTYDDTNVFLSGIGISYDQRWRNFGILWAYIIFNVAAAVALYWLVRMPKGGKKKDDDEKKEKKGGEKK